MPLPQKIITLTAITAILSGNGISYAQSSELLELPFFDDFSYNSKTPDNSLWINSGVDISTTLPKRPPSIGAAVFDALDANGAFYPSQYNIKYSNGDTLTSKPINLNYPGDNTIYLTFFYQPGGFGDAPEPEDALMLDFYSPEDDEWTTVKTFSGSACYGFKQESIAITQRCYLQEGFRFRFRNYFSLGSSKQADLVSNCDFWLLDYIKLDKLRSATDTVYQDVALTNCPEIKIGNYQTVPWSHYAKASDKAPISYSIFYRNNDNEPRMLDSINLILKSKDVVDTLMLGSYNLPSYWDFDETKQFKYSFKSDIETAEYQFGIKLVSDISHQDFAPNNTYFSRKTFADYYAYDDGSAEAGYGIHGEGSTGSLVAVAFQPLAPDYIKGVYIYFNPTFNDAQANFFDLKIWADNNGLPGDELYSDSNLSIPKNECGSFVYFPLKNTVAVTDVFYIGWKKVQNEILNVGFDKSTTTTVNNYYNINGVWKKSAERGQIMIRPSFGSSSTPTEFVPKTDIKSQNITITPNPAKDYLHIAGLGDYPSRVLIISASGKVVKQITLNAEEDIDITDLAEGVYLLKVGNFTTKFLKIK